MEMEPPQGSEGDWGAVRLGLRASAKHCSLQINWNPRVVILSLASQASRPWRALLH